MINKPNWLIEIETDELPIVSEVEKKHISRLVSRLQMIVNQTEEIDKELKELTSENYDYLTTCPGCGIVTASKLIAYVKDIDKFESEKQLAIPTAEPLQLS